MFQVFLQCWAAEALLSYLLIVGARLLDDGSDLRQSSVGLVASET